MEILLLQHIFKMRKLLRYGLRNVRKLPNQVVQHGNPTATIFMKYSNNLLERCEILTYGMEHGTLIYGLLLSTHFMNYLLDLLC